MKTLDEIRAEARQYPPKVETVMDTDIITMGDAIKYVGDAPALNNPGKPSEGAVIALGRAVYETQPQEATDNLLRVVEHLAREIPRNNLWLLPTYERLPYPYAIYWPLACAFRQEKVSGKRFDWFIWMDDDVLMVPQDIWALLRGAKETGAKFVAAVPYDRFPPHSPSVTEMIDGKPWKWVRAPKTGTYPCLTVGLCLAAFHRSVFDVVPEPWFGIVAPSRAFSGLAPDWWWSWQMKAADLTPYVCCDSHPIHLGRKLRVGRELSEKYLDKVVPTEDVFSDMLPEHRTVSTATGAEIMVPSVTDDGRVDTLKYPMTHKVKDGDHNYRELQQRVKNGELLNDHENDALQSWLREEGKDATP